MSTNYYAFGPFPGGDPSGEGLHLGQSAAGWRFLFRAHPEQGLTTLDDWLQFLRRDDVNIRDEYDRDVTVQEMEQTMTETESAVGRPKRARFRLDTDDRYVTSGGHAFYRREFV